MRHDPSRRDVLRLGAVAALAGALSACTAGGTAKPVPTGTLAPTGQPGPGSLSGRTPAPTRSAPPTFGQLAGQISGGLVQAGEAGFDPKDLLYNPRFAGQPAPQAIARCRTSADVAACVRFAAEGGAPLRIRNGGHSYGGWSSGPGLVADLAQLNAVTVDAAAKTATVGAGALLADVYTSLAAQGVSIGAGSCPTVGITGLTLGGGVGVLARAYGLTADQLSSAQVVTADGRLRTVDATADPDLFWALRGGGGSFAALTSLTFAVRPAPMMTTFFLQWPWSAAAAVLEAWQHWAGGTARELWSTCKLLNDPGQGKQVSVSGTWIGSGSVDAQLQGLLAALPRPSTNSRNRASYGSTMLGEAGCAGQDAATCLADALAPAKRQPFAASSSIMQQAMPSDGVDAIVAAVAAASGVADLVEGGVSFDSLGGAVADVAAGATAFAWRTALASVQYTATWTYANAGLDPAPFDAFVRSERQALAPWLGASAYVNYADAAIVDYPSAYWGPNVSRLRQIKKTYDPADVFSFPQSVPV